MNTFVVKSNLHSVKSGKYIGMTNPDDFQYVYIFRSHELFKQANLNLNQEDYTIVEDLHKEFDFRKYNVCPDCGGLAGFYEIPVDKKGNIVNDEDGFCLFGEKLIVHCICEDGTYIGFQDFEIEMAKRQAEQNRKDYLELKDYIEKTSTCKTCGGKQGKTLGLCTCPECGLPGNCPWPG